VVSNLGVLYKYSPFKLEYVLPFIVNIVHVVKWTNVYNSFKQESPLNGAFCLLHVSGSSSEGFHCKCIFYCKSPDTKGYKQMIKYK